MRDTITKGRITELKCLTYLVEHGYNVATPHVICNYDFIVDANDKLYKIQCKTAKYEEDKGAIIFTTSTARQKKTHVEHKKYSNIDYFCTFYNEVCYLIPLNECNTYEKTLRVNSPKNNQQKNIFYLEDYEACKILDKSNI